MKKALLMVALIACLASCKKDHPTISTYNGMWELNSIEGGFGPTVIVPDDKKDNYVLGINGKYVKTNADKTKIYGDYSVKYFEERNGYKHGTITFSNPAYTDAFTFKADTIIVGSSAADGPSYKYIRVKK